MRLFILFFLTFYIPVFSWGAHYLMTERILQHPSMEFAKNRIPVEPIENFLKKEKEGIALVIAAFYDSLEKRGSKRFNRIPFSTDNPGTESFLRAARLNPKTKFSLVKRVIPGQESIYPVLQPIEVSPYLHSTTRYTVFEDVSSQTVSIASILYTFLDEPDWGMDYNLWDIKEYGYGKQPFGKNRGVSSQAPFHITYMHENFMVGMIKPEILEGMSLDRIELFSALAKLAMKTGHPYWGYRFSAWATHYIQDLCQPYHAKTDPSATWINIISIGLSMNKSLAIKNVQQLIANRHFAYEDFVAYTLESSYTNQNKLSGSLSSFLYTGDAFLENSFSNYSKLIYHITKLSSSHGKMIDKAIQESFGKKLTQNSDFDFEKEKKSGNFHMETFLSEMNKEKGEFLLQETGKDFFLTAKATRTFWKMLGIIPDNQ